MNSSIAQEWLVKNPLVRGKSVVDHMFGLDSEECVAKMVALTGEQLAPILSHSPLLFPSLLRRPLMRVDAS